MTYPGGKSGAGVYQTIINQIPPHDLYIEAFLGGAAIMRHKRRAAGSIVIDSDASVLVPWRDQPSVITIHGCALDYLKTHSFTGREFVYLDPPYLMSVRRSQRDIYAHEFASREEHESLLTLARSLPCMVAISGYPCDFYSDRLPGWRRITFTAQTRGGTPATECLWMNYPEPVALHDCRYLGSDFRARERIKRKAARWSTNLDKMDPLERQAVLSAMLQLASSKATMAADIATSDDIGRMPGPIAGCSDTRSCALQARHIRRGRPAPIVNLDDARLRHRCNGRGDPV